MTMDQELIKAMQEKLGKLDHEMRTMGDDITEVTERLNALKCLDEGKRRLKHGLIESLHAFGVDTGYHLDLTIADYGAEARG